MRLPFLTRLARASGGCPSCGNSVEVDQLACIECGALLGRDRRLAAAAWRAPVVLVASLLLVLATGFGFASGAVAEDGEVTVAGAPPPVSPPTTPSASDGAKPPEASDGGSELPKLPKPGEAGGGDDLALAPGDLDGSSGGSGSGSGSGESGSSGRRLSDGGGSSGDRDRPEEPGPSAPSSPRDTFAPERKVTLASWPAAGSAFAVVLKTSRTREAAEREAREAASDGLRAGVVVSSEFTNQPSGRFIAFAGKPFSTQQDAERFFGGTVDPEGYKGTVVFLERAGTRRTE
jgi:predicted nucleic acid-binding Zn ribbon protein